MMSCVCGAAVFERRDYVRRSGREGEPDEVVYRRYICQGCGEASQEFLPGVQWRWDEDLTPLVEASPGRRIR